MEVSALIYLLIFLTATYLIFKDKIQWLMILIYSSYVYLPIIISKISLDFLAFSGFIAQLLIFYSFTIYMITNHRFKEFFSSKLFIYIVIAHIYFVIMEFANELPPLTYVVSFRRNLGNLLILFIIIYDNTSYHSMKRYIYFFVFVLISESIIGLVSYFGPSGIYKFFDYVSSVRLILHGKLISGTFSTPNNYANTLVIIFITIIFLIVINYKNKVNYIYQHFMLLATLAAVLFSGIRTALVSMVIVFFVYLSIFYEKKYLFIFISILIILLGTFPVLSTLKQYGITKKEYSSPIERILGIGANIENINNIQKYQISTLALSLDVLEYFPNAPIFGNGALHKTGYGRVSIEDKNNTDATLALLFVEFGVVGGFIFLWPFIFILQSVYKSCSRVNFYFNLTLFVVLLFQTVTDKGLFLNEANFVYFLISGLQLRETPVQHQLS